MNDVLAATGGAVAAAGLMHTTDPATLFAHLTVVLGLALVGAALVRMNQGAK